MNWGSAQAFWAMDGYGLFVWGSFGVAALILLVEPWLARQRHQRARRDAANSTQDTRL